MKYFAFHSAFFESSLYRSGLTNSLVFQWLLSHCDESGKVIARPWTVARDLSPGDPARFTEEAVSAALAALAAPDAESHTEAEEGRRIVPLEGERFTWRIVTYRHYNGGLQDQRRREKDAERKRRSRANQRDCHGTSRDVRETSRPNTESDSEPDPESESESLPSGECRTSRSETKVKVKRQRRKPLLSFEDSSLSDLPSDWLADAEKAGFSHPEAERQFALFTNHAKANAKRYADWHCAFSNWIERAKEFARKGPSTLAHGETEQKRLAAHFAKYDEN